MNDPCFFGYGSLVNRNTHRGENCRPAVVTGWKRAWLRIPGRALSILSAVRADGVEIAGLVASVPGGDWAALDRREKNYRRHIIPVDGNPVAIYEVPDEVRSAPTGENAILLSYLDVVVQGFLEEFGEAGVAAFFETTDNWHAPVLQDRDAPVYPRARVLSRRETELVDWHIANVGGDR
jgi:hypothetical protein